MGYIEGEACFKIFLEDAEDISFNFDDFLCFADDPGLPLSLRLEEFITDVAFLVFLVSLDMFL